MPLGKATIDWDGYELLVRFHPFNAALVNALKGGLPQHARTWSKEDKCWYVQTIYLAEVTEICEEMDYAVRDYTGDDEVSRQRQQELRKQHDFRETDAEYRRQKKEQQEADEREANRLRNEARAKTAQEARDRSGKGRRPGETDYEYLRRVFGGGQYHEWAKTEEDLERERKDKERNELRWAFFRVWPECQERHFTLWYSFFLVDGRDAANRKFSAAYTEEQRRSGRHYSWEDAARDRGRRNYSQATQQLDAYSVLGIVRSSTDEQVKTAYRELARKHHPNSTYEGAVPDESRMKQINAAWDAIKKARNLT